MSLKLCIFVLALLLASATVSLGSREGPEERLKECSQWCQQHHGEQRRQCQSVCQSVYEKEKEQQRHEGGGSGNPSGRPSHEYEVCSEVCTRGSLSEDWKCERKCEKQEPTGRNDERERQGDQQKHGQNPYVFEDEHFDTGMKTQHGRLRILQKFTDRSELLRGIENYRVEILEAQPQTFVVPSHSDAEAIVFVANGKGTVSSVLQESRDVFNIKERRESFNVEEGDIFRVQAGTTTYLINRDNNERLILVKLIQPVNTPGEFQAFYGAGGENPESFYRVFSNEILEAAFNTRSDKLERLFRNQKQGAIIKASQEQIKAMSGHGEGGIWPFGGESKGTNKHNLYEQRPAQSNQYGQLYEVDSNQFRQLRDLDVAVSLANISRGAMTALHYNSRATKIGVVINGEGYFEMACPHLSQSQGSSRGDESQGQTRFGTGYQKIRSNLKTGTVIVVPAGHPFVAVASNDQNLQILCFEINAYNNQKYTLAGKSNVMKQLEREAKQLSFGVPAREVDEVFNSQPEEFFFRGPRQQHQGRATA
ncbi:hypothetical protein ACS0TY_012924 [Phlomoides rotata]